MTASIETLLGIRPAKQQPKTGTMAFSFLFFPDVRTDITDAEKYDLIRDITQFGDRAGFQAVYLPERHFRASDSIFANAAVMAAYLIPQTQQIRFRTAGISLPLHHPAEIVEWWAMNDILSGGRVDLGFGSGWSKPDFIFAPESYANRRTICSERIPLVQRLWRGETIAFPGPAGPTPITVYPRPLQAELNVWLLVTRNEAGFHYAGLQGYNVFTMLYGNNLTAMRDKVAAYRRGREEAGLDPQAGQVTLMLHTLIHKDRSLVQRAVEQPFREYIKTALTAHATEVPAELGLKDQPVSAAEREKIVDYALQRYMQTAALFGDHQDGCRIVDQAVDVGVDEIACLVNFGVDYKVVLEGLTYLKELAQNYQAAADCRAGAKPERLR